MDGCGYGSISTEGGQGDVCNNIILNRFASACGSDIHIYMAIVKK